MHNARVSPTASLKLNILIVRVSSLGDVVHNMPMVADIHRHYPDANIDWMVEEAYADLVKSVVAHLGDTSAPITRAQDVAKAVWRAATDPSSPMRIPAGADAEAWAAEVR